MDFQCGDILLVDSNKTGAKIVKFLMVAPTLWHHVLWVLTGRIEKERPNYYHAGMFVTDFLLAEQQWKVQIDSPEEYLEKKCIVYRKRTLTKLQQELLQMRALEDIGKIYDIPQLIGKTLTWLTGVKLFVRLLGAFSKEQEICVTRIGDWYEGICDFGVKTKHEITTKIIDNYCRNSKDWEIVYPISYGEYND